MLTGTARRYDATAANPPAGQDVMGIHSEIKTTTTDENNRLVRKWDGLSCVTLI